MAKIRPVSMVRVNANKRKLKLLKKQAMDKVRARFALLEKKVNREWNNAYRRMKRAAARAAARSANKAGRPRLGSGSRH